ncbi:hypothetical protein HGA91_05955 [candidate division WWE3 bacterium]|nr:hypothetical protein [candidate division WWE3 bacterium]
MFQTTTDHAKVREWAQQNNAKPQLIDSPHSYGDKIGIRLDFPGRLDDADLSMKKTVKDITWEEFFKLFDELGLAMEYADTTHAVEAINFYRFVKREQLEAEEASL